MTKKITKRSTNCRGKSRRVRGGKQTKKNYRRKRMSVKRMSRKMKGGERCYDRYGQIDSYGGYYDEDGNRNANCPNKRDDDDNDDWYTKRYGKN
jgi:hypothetical protein